MKRFNVSVMFLLFIGLTSAEILSTFKLSAMIASLCGILKKKIGQQKPRKKKKKIRYKKPQKMRQKQEKKEITDTITMDVSDLKAALPGSLSYYIDLAKKYVEACDQGVQKKIEGYKNELCLSLFTQVSNENNDHIYRVIKWAVENGKTVLVKLFFSYAQGEIVIREKIEEIIALAHEKQQNDIIVFFQHEAAGFPYYSKNNYEQEIFVKEQETCVKQEKEKIPQASKIKRPFVVKKILVQSDLKQQLLVQQPDVVQVSQDDQSRGFALMEAAMNGNIQAFDLNSFSFNCLEMAYGQALTGKKFAVAKAIKLVIDRKKQ